MFAAQPAFEAALHIEQLARDGRLDEFDAAWQKLESEIDTLMEALIRCVEGKGAKS
jgi:hypothetical protein